MTRSPAVGSLAALAVVTAALEAAAVALDPRDVAGTLVIAAGIWFQGAWAALVWTHPRRPLLITGVVANAFLLTTCVVRLVDLGPRQPAVSELLVLVFQGALIAGLSWTLVVAPRVSRRGARTIPAVVGAASALFALASVAMAGPTLAPPGALNPIVGTATRSEAPTRTLPPAGGNPDRVPLANDPTGDPPGLAIAENPSIGPTPTSSDAPPPGSAGPPAGDVAPSTGNGGPPQGSAGPTAGNPGPTPGHAGPTAGPAKPTAAPATPTRTAEPSPTSRTTAAAAAPTERPTASPSHSAVPAISAPRPTIRSTPSPVPATPRPTPAPTPRPTPEPTQDPGPTVAPGEPGTIAFGTNYDPDTLALIGRTSTIHPGELVAWRADLSQPAGAPSLTFTITAPNPNGPEFPHWQQDFGVPDPSYVVIVNRVDLSVYVHREPGQFIMRIRRGPDGPVLAEGRFSLVP